MQLSDTLIEQLRLPRELALRLQQTELPLSDERILALTEGLCDETGYAQAVTEMNEALSPDEDGFGRLKLMLLAADTRSREKYRKAGISDEIFAATMRCFTRFAGEHLVSFGRYGFDREGWAGRQLSLLLFRIGELEYERCENGVLSVHIPSDADMTKEKLDASLRQARAFFRKYYPEYVGAKMWCCSWLLSPALKELLPEHSKIRCFQSLFDVQRTHTESESYKLWVYKNGSLKPEEFPEDTSLQRNMKKFVLSGGIVGEGEGYLLSAHPAAKE